MKAIFCTFWSENEVEDINVGDRLMTFLKIKFLKVIAWFCR